MSSIWYFRWYFSIICFWPFFADAFIILRLTETLVTLLNVQQGRDGGSILTLIFAATVLWRLVSPGDRVSVMR